MAVSSLATISNVTIESLQNMRTTVADGPAPPAQAGGNTKSAVEEKVNEQYDSDASMAFYEHVMGGGGDDIHYGIFRTEQDGLKQSSQNSVEQLAKMAEECGALKKVRYQYRCRDSIYTFIRVCCRVLVRKELKLQLLTQPADATAQPHWFFLCRTGITALYTC